MANLQVAFNATTKVALIQPQGTAIPGGSTKIGEFHHEDVDDSLGVPLDANHVLFHHVRDLLYFVGQLNMQAITIDYARVEGLSVTPPTVTLAPAATQQITLVFTPTDAVNKTVTYESDDTDIATVNGTGLITAVAEGTARITVTSQDGAFVDYVEVTVDAP